MKREDDFVNQDNDFNSEHDEEEDDDEDEESLDGLNIDKGMSLFT